MVLQFRVLVNTEAAAQSDTMFGGGNDAGNEPLGPLQPLQPLPPAVSPPPVEVGVDQYHAVCTSEDVTSCVPDCDGKWAGFWNSSVTVRLAIIL